MHCLGSGPTTASASTFAGAVLWWRYWFFGLGGWAATGKFVGAVIAQGSVAIDSNVKKVQHPTGGVVGQLYVCMMATM